MSKRQLDVSILLTSILGKRSYPIKNVSNKENSKVYLLVFAKLLTILFQCCPQYVVVVKIAYKYKEIFSTDVHSPLYLVNSKKVMSKISQNIINLSNQMFSLFLIIFTCLDGHISIFMLTYMPHEGNKDSFYASKRISYY